MSNDPGRAPQHALGIDFGTSNTVAVAQWPDGRARPLLIDGSPLLPSAVYAEPDGQLIVGRDAVHSARLDPARFEPNPKRRIDDGVVLLGEREAPVVDLIAAVLARVAEEWRRAVGPARPAITLTCPATWGATRRTLLARAAEQAGLQDARLVAEPVAAATYFAQVLGRDVPIGSVVVVHDFGAGTFDASVVARTAEGFAVLGVDGRDDVGGLDVDAAVVEHLGEICAATDAAAWRRLTMPGTVEERRAKRQLWDDVRVAKERLSRTQSADLVVPLLDLELHLTRDELETLATPVLRQTVQLTQTVLRWAKLPEGRLAGVFLVGGASRIPLVATLLHRALGEAPVVIEQPELVVAEGSVFADAALLASEPAAPGLTGELRLVSVLNRAQNAETVRAERPPGRDDETVRADRHPGRDDETVRAERHPAPDGETVRADRDRDPGPDAETVRADRRLVRAEAAPAPAERDLARIEHGDGPDEQHPGSAPAPVDPWPDALIEPWVDDPRATALGEAWSDAAPAGPGPDRPSAHHESAGPAVDSGAWRGTATVRPKGASRSTPGRRPPNSTRVEPAFRPASAPWPSPGPVSPAAGPVSPARPAPARPASPAPDRRAAARPAPKAVPKSAAPAPVKAARPRRRPGRFLRLLQVLTSLAVLCVVPILATVVAYGYGNGQPLRQDAADLLRNVAHALGLT